ncbi:unnamed protein product [Bursaphelenchus xylophilus]|uniref:(pine wood nematode) hypothetical protein n=1 Tax=Bursaphelenchus xylophilus TaxID=6326 RepID=A0A1I7RV33_BURXY|nr:unnamed protein product [Bursaphelenchus xylophilus]CAG9105157.1 unnamed protein product [Bursaphelenchus xylophilus]
MPFQTFGKRSGQREKPASEAENLTTGAETPCGRDSVSQVWRDSEASGQCAAALSLTFGPVAFSAHRSGRTHSWRRLITAAGRIRIKTPPLTRHSHSLEAELSSFGVEFAGIRAVDGLGPTAVNLPTNPLPHLVVSTASVDTDYSSSSPGVTDDESSFTDFSSTTERIPTERRSRRRRRRKPTSRIEWSSVSSADSSRPPSYFANSAALTYLYSHQRDQSNKITDPKEEPIQLPQEENFFVPYHKRFNNPVTQTPPPLSTNKARRKESSYWKNRENEEIDLPSSSCNEGSTHKYSSASTASVCDQFQLYKKALAELDHNERFNELVKKYGLQACISSDSTGQLENTQQAAEEGPSHFANTYEVLQFYYPFNNLRRAPTPFRVINIDSDLPSTARMETSNGTRPDGENGGYSGTPVKGICTIPARKSGVFALSFQGIAFVLCAAIVSIFFCHIGGYSTIANGVFHIGVNRTHVNEKGEIIGYSQAFAVSDWHTRVKRQNDENPPLEEAGDGEEQDNNTIKKGKKKGGKGKNKKKKEDEEKATEETDDQEAENVKEPKEAAAPPKQDLFPTPIQLDQPVNQLNPEEPQPNPPPNMEDEIDLPQTDDVQGNADTIPTAAATVPSTVRAAEITTVPSMFQTTTPSPVIVATTNAGAGTTESEELIKPDDELQPTELNTTQPSSTATMSTSDLSEDLDEEEPGYYEKIYDGPFPLVRPAILHIGNLEFELLNILRASCVVYLVLCFIWFLSLICLGMSLYFEVLDLVYINIFVLTVVSVYTLIKALLVGILIFKQKAFDWHILGVISGTVGILILGFVFMLGAMVLMVIWYRYIDYMNGGNETCLCTSSIAHYIKSRRGSGRQQQPRQARQNAAGDYSIPEATQHANLPYIDEPPVHQFSNF